MKYLNMLIIVSLCATSSTHCSSSSSSAQASSAAPEPPNFGLEVTFGCKHYRAPSLASSIDTKAALAAAQRSCKDKKRAPSKVVSVTVNGRPHKWVWDLNTRTLCENLFRRHMSNLDPSFATLHKVPKEHFLPHIERSSLYNHETTLEKVPQNLTILNADIFDGDSLYYNNGLYKIVPYHDDDDRLLQFIAPQDQLNKNNKQTKADQKS